MSAETSTLPSQHSQQQQQQQQQQQLQGITQGNTFPLQSVPMSLPVPLPVALPSQLTAAGGLPFQNASLYVGDLHPDVTDSTLYDIFNAVGPVASIRVCRDALSRKSLGYAYVNFHSPKDAERALDTMNYTLIKDRPCRIMWSQRDPNLRKTGQGNVFVKHLDLSIDNKALYDTFSLFGNILSCKVVTDGQGKSRGYGFVHFETPEAAEDAIKKINGMLIAGKEVFVGRFLKKHDRPTAKDFTNVYVKNLPKQWTKQELEDFFSVCGPIASSIIMTSNNLSPEESKSKSKGFGFIDFAEHEGAENAINKFNGFELIVDEIRDTKEQLTKKENKDVSENSDNIEQNAESQLSQVSQEKDNNNEDNFSEKSTETNIEKLPNGKVKLTLSVCRAQKKSERERELAQKFHELKIERQNKYDGVNLYVKNLDDRVDDEILKHEFASFGNITSARVMRERNSVNNLDNFEQGENVEESDNSNKDSGKVLPPSKGFGFVCYSSPEEAVKAVTEMNGKMLYGKPLYVTLAQRKDQRRVQLESQHRQQQRLLNMGPNLGNNMGNIGGLNNMAGLNGLNNMPGLNNLNMIPGVGNVMNNVNMGGLNNLNNLMMMQNLAAQRGFNNNNNVPNSQNLGAQMFDKPNPKNIIQQPQLGTNNNVGFQGLNNRPSVRPRNINPNFPNNNNSQINQIQGPPPFMARNNNNNIQFNQNARNTNLNMFQQQQQQQQNMPRRPNFAQNSSINNVNSSQGQSLNPALLAQASPEDRKTLIGEQLYPLVARLEPSHSAKITGMLLEMDNPELLHLIESPESLMMKVREAVEILRHAQGNE